MSIPCHTTRDTHIYIMLLKKRKGKRSEIVVELSRKSIWGKVHYQRQIIGKLFKVLLEKIKFFALKKYRICILGKK